MQTVVGLVPHWLLIVFAGIATVWGLLLGVATIWPMFTEKTLPRWFADRRVRMKPGLFDWISIGLGAAILLALMLNLIWLLPGPRPVTTENIEENLRRWTDARRYAVKRLETDKTKAMFSYEIQTSDDKADPNRRLLVSLPVLESRAEPYLQIETVWSFGVMKPVMDKLPVTMQRYLRSHMRRELLRADMRYQFIDDGIVIFRRFQITSDTREHEFVNALGAVERAAMLMKEVFDIEMLGRLIDHDLDAPMPSAFGKAPPLPAPSVK